MNRPKPKIQVFTKSPLDNEYRNDFSSEPTAMSLAENESGCECSPEVAEKVENSDQQLLPMNEAPGEAHQPVPAEDQLSATLPTENEYKNSCPLSVLINSLKLLMISFCLPSRLYLLRGKVATLHPQQWKMTRR